MSNVRRHALAFPLFLALGTATITAATMTEATIAGPALAADESFDAATRGALQGIITKQLDAFGHDDAKAAEAFAAPAIQDRFKADEFFAMVKENYAALIRPKSTSFGETTPSPHGPLQKVTIVAADGTVWTAVYSFEQVNGEWRISACGLLKDESQQAI